MSLTRTAIRDCGKSSKESQGTTYIFVNTKHGFRIYRYQNTHLTIRNTQLEDISKIVDLQNESFPYLARYGNIWHPEELESHFCIFPQGQFVAVERDGTIVGSASTLIVSIDPEFKDHTWKEITANGMFRNHDPKGDSLYGANIYTSKI